MASGTRAVSPEWREQMLGSRCLGRNPESSQMAAVLVPGVVMMWSLGERRSLRLQHAVADGCDERVSLLRTPA